MMGYFTVNETSSYHNSYPDITTAGAVATGYFVSRFDMQVRFLLREQSRIV